MAANDATATDVTRVVAFSGLMEIARVGGRGIAAAAAAMGIVVVVSRLITKFSNERWKSA